MLKRISVALVVLCLVALAFSFLTDGKMDACCAAATIPCVRSANKAIAVGKDWREEAAKELDCLTDRLASKEAEMRVLIVKPSSYARHLQITSAEIYYLKGVIETRQAR